MRFNSTINNVRLIEWEINITQGALVDLINQASSWAKAIVIDGVTFYWMSFGKVCEELPSVFSKEDTVYRQYKALKEKGIIDHIKLDGKDYVRLTEKGCTWNQFEPIRYSEKNPSNGNKPEQGRKKIRENSEKNPTDNINNNKYNQDHNNPPSPPTGEKPEAMVLNYLNSALKKFAEQVGERKPVGFKLGDTIAKTIAARVKESSLTDCERVIDYLIAKWGRDEFMREYLTPTTIFRKSKFVEYVSMSQGWSDRGRLVFVNGKWVKAEDITKRINTPTVEEVQSYYFKYLSVGKSIFRSLDLSQPRNKILYYATIGTKSKRPLERDMHRIIAEEIRATVERLDSLPTPLLEAKQ